MPYMPTAAMPSHLQQCLVIYD